MILTEICELLDIKYPIIQGGMAWVATAELAGAVSNSGGLGIIGAGNAPVEVIEQEIKKAKKLTQRPFGVNIMLLSPYSEDIVELVCSENIPVVTTGAGNPGKYMGKLKNKGVKVIPVISSVALAKRMEKQGADAVIAEGHEAGGHVGELTTFTLVPQVVDGVDIPVIAAGGIGDGRGLAAALSLGAKGIQMGTRFICTQECTVHINYKQAIMKAKDRSSTITGLTTGHPVRILKNKLARQFKKFEDNGISIEDIEKLGAGSLKNAVIDGDVDFGSVMAGQISGIIKDISKTSQVIEQVIKDAENTIDKLKRMSDKDE